MTRYEELTNKITLLRLAAVQTTGWMRQCWIVKAEVLEDIRDFMSIEDAQRMVTR